VIAWFLGSAVARAACTVILGATVHLDGAAPVVTNVVVEDDRIAGVGATIPALTGASFRSVPCTSVDGTGRQLTAGFVGAPTQVGLVGIDLERGSRDDDSQNADDPIRASLVAADAYDPLSVVIPVTRLGGVTSVLTVPRGGLVSGAGAFVRLRGATQAEAVVAPIAVMSFTLDSRSFADALRQVRELVLDVRTHARTPALYDQGRPYFRDASRLDLEALRPVVEGRVPVLVPANRASELEALVRMKAQLGLDLVVVGGAEGWKVAAQLAAAQIPVIVDPLVYGPNSFDEVHARPDNAALLAAAGVPLILSAGPFETQNVRTLRQAAGNAVREGLSHADAIRAITATPARVFGQPDRGRLAAGTAADLVLWSGDPLELSSVPEHVWIGGVDVALVSRQTELRDKYRTLPGTPSAGLPLP
jgi:imidazolonepropionase-like amidohydrolase